MFDMAFDALLYGLTIFFLGIVPVCMITLGWMWFLDFLIDRKEDK